MAGTVNLLRRAKGDLTTAQRNIDHWSDEVELDIAAYHLQQAVEKMLKFKLTLHGISWEFTHDIDKLLDIFDANSIPYPDWIGNYSITITQFATHTRYGKNLVASKRVLDKLLPLIASYLTTLQAEENSDTNFSPKTEGLI